MYLYFSAPKCPVIMDDKGATFEVLTEYLIARRFTHRLDYSTVEADARNLAKYANYLAGLDVKLFDATSLNLENFRDDLEGEISPRNVNLHLAAVCAFYWWAQEQEHCSNMIGWNDKATKLKYRIVVNRSKGQGSAPYDIPFKLPAPQMQQKYVPSNTEIRGLEDHIASGTESSQSAKSDEVNNARVIRDLLIFHWLTTVGLRREELVSLKVDQIPQVRDSDSFLVSVVVDDGAKFNKSRRVEVPKDLVAETLSYIEYERPILLEAHGKKFGDPCNISTLFVNGGNAARQPKMNANTIYQKYTDYNPVLTPHALRRYALTKFATVLYRLGRKLNENKKNQGDVIRSDLLYRVAKQAGHQSPDTTIRFYVDLAETYALSDEEIESLTEREKKLELSMIKDRIEKAKVLSSTI